MRDNKKLMQTAIAGIASLAVVFSVASAAKVIYNKHISPPPVGDTTMMSLNGKNIETKTPVSSAGKKEVYLPYSESEAIPLPTVNPKEEEKTTTSLPVGDISYPLDTSVPYEDAISVFGMSADGLRGYKASYPGLYAEKHEVVPVEDKTIYLTFDDGPSANTRVLLDELDKCGVKATFFVYPGSKNAETTKELLVDIANRGHAIAIHTYSHDYKAIYQSVDTFLADMDKVNRFVYEATGIRPSIYRFPGGSNNGRAKNVAADILNEMERRGFRAFDWNSSTQDAEGKKFTASELAKNAISTMSGRKRVIVLAHDGGGQKTTPYSVAEIVKYAKDNGYTFDTLDNSCGELLFFKR